jgi:WD40 repeat protein
VSGGTKTLIIWDAKTRACLKKLPAHDDAITSIAYDGLGLVYTGSNDRTIQIWKVGNGSLPVFLQQEKKEKTEEPLPGT